MSKDPWGVSYWKMNEEAVTMIDWLTGWMKEGTNALFPLFLQQVKRKYKYQLKCLKLSSAPFLFPSCLRAPNVCNCYKNVRIVDWLIDWLDGSEWLTDCLTDCLNQYGNEIGTMQEVFF